MHMYCALRVSHCIYKVPLRVCTYIKHVSASECTYVHKCTCRAPTVSLTLLDHYKTYSITKNSVWDAEIQMSVPRKQPFIQRGRYVLKSTLYKGIYFSIPTQSK